VKIVAVPVRVSSSQRPKAFGYTVIAVLACLAWGSLAFGAVYPWAYWPLLVLCVTVGLLSVLGRDQAAPTSKPLFIGLLVVIGAVLLQLLPLPAAVVHVLSPSSEQFANQRQLVDPAPAASAAYPMTVSPRETMRGLAFVVAFGVLLLGTSRSLTSRDIRLLVRGIGAIGVTLALFGMAQQGATADKVYWLWQPYYAGLPFGPFMNRNHFAGWMLMAIPVVVGYGYGHLAESLARVAPTLRARVLWFASPDANEIVLMTIAILLMVLSLTMTLSRSGMTCLVLAMIMFGSVAARKQTGRDRVVLIVCLLAAGAAAAAWGGTDAVIDRFANTDASEVAMRQGIWRDAIRIAGQSPIVGTGLNTYRTARALYAPNTRFTAVEAHSDYLQLAAEGGVLVVGAAGTFLLLFVREAAKRLRESTPGSPDFWIRVGAVAGLISVALQETAEFSLQMPGNAALFAVLCALAAHPTPSR
jgi:O-antigen ligase